MSLAESRSAARQHALLEAKRRFADARPYGRRLHEEACKWLPGGNTRTVLFHEPFPLSVRSADGSQIWDHDGHCYIDFLNDHTAGLFGHSDATITDAVKMALAGGLNGCGNTLSEVEAASLVCNRFKSIEKVRFTPSGTEANLMALTLAKVATGRSRIIVFLGAYHGSGLLFRKGRAGTNLPFKFVVVEYNDWRGLELAFEKCAHDIAAVLVEPMLGSGGCIPADKAFLNAARRLTRDSGALLIFDEVMTSRLAWGGLQGTYGVSPDLTTLGKYLAGGLPIGAFGGDARLMSFLDPANPDSMSHNGTFNNNAVSMAATVAALQSYDRAAAQSLNGMGDRLRRELNNAGQGRGAALCFGGLGSMLHFHTQSRPPRCYMEPSAADQDLRTLLYFDLLEHGMRISPKGLLSLSRQNTLDDCNLLVEGFSSFLDQRAGLLDHS